MADEIEETLIKNKELEFQLTADDKARIIDNCATLSGEVTADKIEFKQIRTEWKDRINGKECALARMLKVIHDGKETRMSDCIQRKNFTKNSVEYLVEGKVIEEHAMTVRERQGDMFDEVTSVPDARMKAAGDDSDDDDDDLPGLSLVPEPPEQVEVHKENKVTDSQSPI